MNIRNHSGWGTAAANSGSPAENRPISDTCCPNLYQSWPRRSCPCCSGRGWICDPPFHRPFTALGFFAPPANYPIHCCHTHGCSMMQTRDHHQILPQSAICCSCCSSHRHGHSYNPHRYSNAQYGLTMYCSSCGTRLNAKPHSVSVQTCDDPYEEEEEEEINQNNSNNNNENIMKRKVSVEESPMAALAILEAIKELKKHAREHPSRLRPAMIIHPMPLEIHRLLKPFDRKRFGSWRGAFPAEGEVFKHWGRHYMIAESKSVPKAGRGLFILDFARKGDVLMCYAGPEYDEQTWELLCCIPRIQMYGMFANMPSIRERTKKGESVNASDRVYIDGRPEEYGNIAALTNSSNQTPSLTNCSFEEATGHVAQYMPRPVKMYIAFVATKDLVPGNELFVNYEF